MSNTVHRVCTPTGMRNFAPDLRRGNLTSPRIWSRTKLFTVARWTDSRLSNSRVIRGTPRLPAVFTAFRFVKRHLLPPSISNVIISIHWFEKKRKSLTRWRLRLTHVECNRWNYFKNVLIFHRSFRIIVRQGIINCSALVN